MNNRLSQSYRSLGPAERALLLIAAAARDDLADAYALLSAAPRRTFTAANSHCTSVALHALRESLDDRAKRIDQLGEHPPAVTHDRHIDLDPLADRGWIDIESLVD